MANIFGKIVSGLEKAADFEAALANNKTATELINLIPEVGPEINAGLQIAAHIHDQVVSTEVQWAASGVDKDGTGKQSVVVGGIEAALTLVNGLEGKSYSMTPAAKALAADLTARQVAILKDSNRLMDMIRATQPAAAVA